MTLAEKLIRLRKKSGRSQEEFAEALNVSRQAVSKWESGQSMPELDKILQISALYDVTTDYLLKDEITDEASSKAPESASSAPPDVRRVSLSEAEDYLTALKSASRRIALGAFLCILAVTPLLSLIGASNDRGLLPIKSAVGIGLLLLFVFIAGAVGLFVYAGFRLSPFSFLENGAFSIDSGVRDMIKERQKERRRAHMICNVIGACLCVLSPIPLLLGSFTENSFIVLLTLSFTLLIVGIGAVFFIIAGNERGGMMRLLGEGGELHDDGTPKLRSEKIADAISSVYWLTMTAIYLAWSFISGDWNKTWIVWPIAGVVFAAVMAVINLFFLKEDK